MSGPKQFPNDWLVNGKPESNTWLDLEPVRVLYEFDGPRIFTCRDSAGNLFLAYQCGEEDQVMRFWSCRSRTIWKNA